VVVLLSGAGLLGFQMATALLASRKLEHCWTKADEITPCFRAAVVLGLDASDYRSVIEMTDAGVQQHQDERTITQR
jgi:hypothetical protein